jgi:hypothetical protein
MPATSCFDLLGNSAQSNRSPGLPTIAFWFACSPF